MKRTKNLQDLANTLSKECFGTSLGEAHRKRICIQCKKKAGEFADDEDRMEWEISGLGICCRKDYFD